jgi:hypothetical protein
MKEANHFPVLIPLAALAFAAAHLAFEHFTGGVVSHHLLHRQDLPAISNWFGLITLPILGVVFGLRVRAHPNQACWAGVPIHMLAAFLGALIYGAMLAASFELGATSISSAIFLGSFAFGLLFPVYRVEYILGFVVGMTITFGGVLPLFVASVVAVVSFVFRYIFKKIASTIHQRNRFP